MHMEFIGRRPKRVSDGPLSAVDIDGHVAAVLVLAEGGLDVSFVDLVAAAGCRGLAGR